MATVISAADTVNGLGLSADTTGALTLQVGPNGGKINAVQVDATGKVSLTGQTVSASVTNTVTNKVAIVINGTTYYLLASTSGA